MDLCLLSKLLALFHIQCIMLCHTFESTTNSQDVSPNTLEEHDDSSSSNFDEKNLQHQSDFPDPGPPGNIGEDEHSDLPSESELLDLNKENYVDPNLSEDNAKAVPDPPIDILISNDYLNISAIDNKIYIDEPIIQLKVNYSFQEYNNFYIIGVYYEEISNAMPVKNVFFKHQFRYNFDEKISTNGTSIVNIPIPSQLIYYDHQNSTMFTNYFVSKVEFKAMLVITDEQDGFEVTSTSVDSLDLLLQPPWDRDQKPTYSFSWIGQIIDMLERRRIPKCQKHSDHKIISNIVPSLGQSSLGYLRKVQEARWPSHLPPALAQHLEHSVGMTITFWMFITKPCNSGGCFIIQQRNTTNFHSLVVILNNEGKLHVQAHDSRGHGEAFVSLERLPHNKWIFVMIRVSVLDIKLKFNFNDQSHVYSYSRIYTSFNKGNNSFWASSGYFVQETFSGYLAKFNVHQYESLDYQQYLKHFKDSDKQEINQIISEDSYQKCKAIKTMVNLALGHGILGKQTCSIEEILYPKRPPNTCALKKKRPYWRELKALREKLKVLRENWAKDKRDLHMMVDVGAAIHKDVMKNLTKKFTPDLMPLLNMAGCLGYGKSYFVLATIHQYGISNVEPNQDKALSYHLMAAQLSEPLSHLSLAYRYQLTHNGLLNDLELQAAHTRQAAIITKNELDQEKYEINTQSELIRLDEANSYSDTRGGGSDLYKWLNQQAKMGSLEAKNQMADMLFHGKQGVEANQELAMEHFNDLADAGDPVAMVNLAVMHIKGINNMEKNVTKAKILLEKAVAKNSSFAYNVLGFIEIHYNQNATAAMHYWKKGVEYGDVQSTFNYASVMEQTNHTEALKYYEKAANQGDRHSIFRLAELLMEGTIIKRDPQKALEYYKVIGEQHESLGWFMRHAMNHYLEGRRYSSIVNYLLALEGGLQLAGFNMALLLKEMDYNKENTMHLFDAKPLFFVNFTAELGWSTSLVEMGDQSWTKENDTQKASLYYTRAVQKNDHPEALYSLGYLVENQFSIDHSILIESASHWKEVHGNLTYAAKLYQSCMASQSENQEGYFPCQLALFKVQLKSLIYLTIPELWDTYQFEVMCFGMVLSALVPFISYQIYYD
eukprot:TCONS_00045802-protein